jgi:excinuclease ABC subunit A
MKLVTELSGGAIAQKKEFLKTRYATKASSLYLLEEPTVGLHLADVKLLIDVLHRLVDEGHTVVVIEHHLNVIAEADYVIELGPQSGAGGGQIVFQGTPEDLILCKTSATAKFLKNAFPSSRNALAKKA